MNKQPEKCATYLLEDLPAEKDAFGPHQRVADAICDLVTSPNETGGKAIGLEGGWGSGKSTVVNFVAQSLDKSKDYQIVLFDAWSHEGDPLRRTCIEAIIKSLQKCGWLGKAKWDETLEEIAKRRKETTTSITPSATWLGTALAVSVFAVPIGVTLLRPIIKAGIASGINQQPWLFFLMSLLALAPFGVLLGNLIRVAFLLFYDLTKGRRGSRNWAGEWSFVVGEAVKETRTKSFEMPDPTSIEFQQYFDNAMSEALGGKKNKKRRLVLILDNLDRVEPESAVAIWSTLQTFIQQSNGGNGNEWFSSIWVLVPYDPSGIRKLWDGKASRTVKGEDPNRSTSRPSSSFLDKSFQIRFQVPPPVLSDWKSYLFTLVERAMPSHGDDCHDLYRVYEYCRTKSIPPTPRQLKLYVNQIGAIHRQWEHTFPLGHVAYYVAHSQRQTPMIDRLLTDEFPPEAAVRMLDDGLEASLAGLAFNVEAKKGMELLLSDSIQQCLLGGSGEELVEISKTSAAGFWPVTEKVVSTKLQSVSTLELARVSTCLGDSKLLESHDYPEAETIKSDLKGLFLGTKNWLPLDDKLTQGISHALVQQQDAEFTESVLNVIAASVAKPDDSEDDYRFTKVAKSLTKIIETAEKVGHLESVPLFILPAAPKDWCDISTVLVENECPAEHLNFILTNVASDEIDEYLETIVTEGSLQTSMTDVFEVDAKHASETCSWDKFVEASKTKLTTDVALTAPQLSNLLRSLWRLMDQGNATAKDALVGTTTTAAIYHHYSTASGEGGRPSCRAVCLLTALIGAPNDAAPTVPIGTSVAGKKLFKTAVDSSDETLAKSLSSFLRANSTVEHLLSIARQAKEPIPIVRACFQQIATSETSLELFNAQTLDSDWSIISENLGDDAKAEGGSQYEALLSRLVENDSLCEDLMSLNSGFSPSNKSFYWRLVTDFGKEQPAFSKWCCENVEAQPKEVWKDDLEDAHDLIWLALMTSDAGHPPKLTTHFTDALIEYADSIIKDEAEPDETVLGRWKDVVNLIDASTWNSAVSRLLDLAMEQDGDLSANFLKMFGSEIIRCGGLGTKESVVSLLFSPIVRKRNKAGVDWLISIVKDDSELLSDLSALDNVAEFRTRIQDGVNTPLSDEVQPLLESLGASIGIVRPIEEPEDTSDEESEETKATK